jgi:hypothetical protein
VKGAASRASRSGRPPSFSMAERWPLIIARCRSRCISSVASNVNFRCHRHGPDFGPRKDHAASLHHAGRTSAREALQHRGIGSKTAGEAIECGSQICVSSVSPSAVRDIRCHPMLVGRLWRFAWQTDY